MEAEKSKNWNFLAKEGLDKRKKHLILLILLVLIFLVVSLPTFSKISKGLFSEDFKKSLKESTLENRSSDKKSKSSSSSPLPASNQNLDMVETEHFQVFSDNKDFGLKVAEKSEEYYQLIPASISLPDPASFGAEIIKIYLYESEEDYQRKTNKPKWSKGYADYTEQAIYLYETENLEGSVLPHELAHIFFDTYVGYQTRELQWIDEGLAMSQQIKYDPYQQSSLEESMAEIREGNFLPLEELASKDLSKEDDLESINLWYAQSLSIVTYLREEFNDSKFKSFIRLLKNRKSLEESLEEVYNFDDLDELEEEWFNYLESH